MQETSISWTDRSWAVTRGCERISPGCGGKVGEGGCYAEKIAGRFSKPNLPFYGFAEMTPRGARWTGKVTPLPDNLDEPLRLRKPQRIFVNSMSDLFHEDVPDEYIAGVFGMMAACPQHIFQVLTKRAERMEQWFKWLAGEGSPSAVMSDALGYYMGDYSCCEGDSCVHMRAMEAVLDLDDDVEAEDSEWPLPNVHLGVSVEDRKYGVPRIEHLRRCPAAVRFLSVEPQLEDIGLIDLTGISWLIQGGESGPGARPFALEWAAKMQAHCAEHVVPYFCKQMGANPTLLGERVKYKAKKGDDPSEWGAQFRVQQFPLEAK